jgi:hypothetical protein
VNLSNEAIDEALDTILRSVGFGSSPIKTYMPLSQERARKAMRDLIAKHQQQATVIPIIGTIGK